MVETFLLEIIIFPKQWNFFQLYGKEVKFLPKIEE